MDSRDSAQSDFETEFWNKPSKEEFEPERVEEEEFLLLKTKKERFRFRFLRKLERRDKLEKHNNRLRTEIGHYIQNNLPIRLIQVSNMVLVDRAKLQEQISKKITEGTFICNELICRCFRKIKDELKYSILSHRWGFPELTFGEYGKLCNQTIHDNQAVDATMSMMKQLLGNTPFKPSLDKLLEFQKVSSQRQCKYAWVDSICINKESSAELDESIRSMYAWYRDSHICIVHLGQTNYAFDMKDDPWFTRGWTLQELLAPKRIKFFSASWKQITCWENDKDLDSAEQPAARGCNDKPPLWSKISNITGIPIDDLLDFKPGLYNVGERMNWASRRTTTRVEDMAYCLIGIFHVNLSIAYGEKEGAFYRLQVEIMQNSDDQSLFDWRGPASAFNSTFAASPKCFSEALGVYIDPTGTGQTSTSVVNFERRVSRKMYHKSEVPGLEMWSGSKATAFTILGPSKLSESSEHDEYILMIFEQIGAQHYKRLDVVKAEIKQQLPEKSPSEIFFK